MTGLGPLVLFYLIAQALKGANASWPTPKPVDERPVPPPVDKAGTPSEKPAEVKLTPLPGGGWKFYQPLNPPTIARAKELLPQLAMGQLVLEADASGKSQEVVYRKEPHPKGKVGVTVYMRPASTSSS